MRTLYRCLCLALSVLLAALDVFFLAETALSGSGSEGWFLSFCFLLSALFFLFLAYVFAMSFRHGTYYLPEILFDEEGRLAKLPFAAAGASALIGLAGLAWFGLALLGLNAAAAAFDRPVLELIVSTSAMVAFVGLFSFAYALLFRNLPAELR